MVKGKQFHIFAKIVAKLIFRSTWTNTTDLTNAQQTAARNYLASHTQADSSDTNAKYTISTVGPASNSTAPIPHASVSPAKAFRGKRTSTSISGAYILMAAICYSRILLCWV